MFSFSGISGYKSRKNWLTLTKFWYVFTLSYISVYTKNCDHVLAKFYKDTTKSWFSFFFFIYVPFSISLCDNNAINWTGSVTGWNIIILILSYYFNFQPCRGASVAKWIAYRFNSSTEDRRVGSIPVVALGAVWLEIKIIT